MYEHVCMCVCVRVFNVGKRGAANHHKYLHLYPLFKSHTFNRKAEICGRLKFLNIQTPVINHMKNKLCRFSPYQHMQRNSGGGLGGGRVGRQPKRRQG